VLLDGDKAGEAQKKRIMKICGLRESLVITLSGIGLGKADPEVEDLFSSQFKTDRDVKTKGLIQAVKEAIDKGVVDAETLDNFERVFVALESALNSS